MFKLTIETNNAAFSDDEPHLGGNRARCEEIGRILERLSRDLYRDTAATSGILRDTNGNTVGRWSIGK